MAKISAIKQQVKRQDRYSVYVDGKYVFSLSETELLNTGLKIGRELSDREIAELKDRSGIEKAYERALDLISRRPRSEWELQDYLKRKNYDNSVIDQVLKRLRDRNYVDDEDFASRWVNTRRLLKSTSKRRLAQELRQKRVDDAIIKQVLAEDETDERSVLRELIDRKRKQPKYQDNRKLMQYLSRQGFNYDDIKFAIEDS